MFIMISTHQQYIRIRGLSSKQLLGDIAKMMQNTRIVNNMFTPITLGIQFHQFYLPDVFFLLQRLRDQSKSIAYRYKTEALMKELKARTWLGQVDQPCPPRLDLSKLNHLRYPPLPHQTEFFEYYNTKITPLKLRGSLLAAAPGLGKTYSSLAIGECLNADLVIIVSPLNAIVRVWEQNIRDVFVKPQTYWLSTSGKPYTNERFVVVHYEALSKLIDMLPKFSRSTKRLIILDECHNLNEIKSQRTQNFLRVVDHLKDRTDVLFMSGTAIKAVGQESLTLFKSVDPFFDDEVMAGFKKIYNENAKLNNQILNARLGNISFFIEKSVLNLDKPNVIDVKIRSPNADQFTLVSIAKDIEAFIKARTEYYKERRDQDYKDYDRCIDTYRQTIVRQPQSLRELEEYLKLVKIIQRSHDRGSLRDVLEEMELANKFENSKILPSLTPDLKVKFKEVKTIVKYLKLKIQGECLGRVLGRARIDCHVDMVSAIDFKTIIEDSALKTVVFSTFVEVCEATVAKVTELGYKPLAVYGKFTKQLSEVVSKFEKDESLNPLIATYASLSTAVPLIMANTAIMVNPPFRSYIYEQAVSRVHRLGATTPVFIYNCSLDTGDRPNISTRGVEIMDWSSRMVAEITGIENPYAEADMVLEGDQLSISNESLDIHEVVDIRSELRRSLSLGW